MKNTNASVAAYGLSRMGVQGVWYAFGSTILRD